MPLNPDKKYPTSTKSQRCHAEVSESADRFHDGRHHQQTGKSGDAGVAHRAVMAGLFDKIGWMNQILALVSYLVVVVAGGRFWRVSTTRLTSGGASSPFCGHSARAANRVCRDRVESRLHRPAGCHRRLYRLRGDLHRGVGGLYAPNRNRFGPFEIHSVFLMAPVCVILVGAIAGVLPLSRRIRRMSRRTLRRLANASRCL